jgi:hypothetical protein
MTREVETEHRPGKYWAPPMALKRAEWVQKYGLTVDQLDRKTVEHLLDCTPLGQEILLIIMRLEAQPFTAAVKANEGRLGRLFLAEVREKAQSERAAKTQQRNDRRSFERSLIRDARRKMQKQLRPKMPRVVRALEINEPDARVGRLVELAMKVRVA